MSSLSDVCQAGFGMADETQTILADAVARNIGLILSLPSAGMLRHHKSRFLGECPEGLWIESAPTDANLIDELIGHQQPAAVSFKSGTGKTSFVATILKREASYRINAEITAEALLLRRPTSVKSMQRRSDYRVRVTSDSELLARVWRIGEQADLRDVPMSYTEVPMKLRDLSIGGMGMMIEPAQEGAAALVADQRMRVELMHQGVPIILDGRLRHVPKAEQGSGAKLRVGIQFKKLQNDLEGRQTIAMLTRIVGELQRDEARRCRMGLAEAS